jgi:hypothetical protein
MSFDPWGYVNFGDLDSPGAPQISFTRRDNKIYRHITTIILI